MPDSTPSLSDDLSTVSFERTKTLPNYEFLRDAEAAAAYRRAMGQLSALTEGDTDPWMGLKIYRVIRKSTRFIVYLDDRLDVQWWWLIRPNEALVSRVQARISQLTKESAFLLESERATRDRYLAEKIRHAMGEAMALALNDALPEDCEAALAEAQRYIAVSKDQHTRPTFLLSFFAMVLSLGVILALWVCFGSHCCTRIDAKFVGQWLEAAVAGSAGAMISALLRTSDLGLEPAARKQGLFIEAAARALIGAGSGMLVAFAYDSGLLLKEIIRTDGNAQHIVRLFLCIVSGVSERILPSLVGKAESLVDAKADDGSSPKNSASGKEKGTTDERDASKASSNTSTSESETKPGG
jgi:hypothetical protein